MAIFQGENLAFKIVMKDDNGDLILTSSIQDIYADIYNEATLKLYIAYQKNSDNSDILHRNIVAAGDLSGFEFKVHGVDSATLPPGRYIIQITYTTLDAGFNNDNGKKITIQKGALLSILKSI